MSNTFHMEADARQFKWQRSAACHGVPSYIFFPDERKLESFKEHPAYKGKTFKDFCSSCRVRNVCKEFALLHNERGCWGGTTDVERDKIYSIRERREIRLYKSEVGKYFPLHGDPKLNEDE